MSVALIRPACRSRAAQALIDGTGLARDRHLLGVAARLVAQFGAEFLPLFEMMEREVREAEAREADRAGALTRALALAEA